ncbi:MAG: hypothetical protein Ct9H300mP23_10080 [Nitrospinota bacterium]|nr:MAG: hypothetical protein Ct9H300mP23_10080 [Nitrospinota bacterium]
MKLKDSRPRILTRFKTSKKYRLTQMTNYHMGHYDLKRAIYEIKRETRHYAKRQLTWFRKMPDAQIIATEKMTLPKL